MDNNNQLTSLLIGSYSYLDKTNLMRENKKALDNNTSNNNHSFDKELKRV